jgi:nitronate monooxygenase
MNRETRRTFLERTVALGASLSALRLGAKASAQVSGTTTTFGQPAREFMAMLGLRFPIVQAALSGAGGPELASAVADAGALGALALTPETPDAAERVVRQVKAATKGAFFVNYVLRSDPPSLPRVLDAGAPVIQFSWGMPSAEHVRRIRAATAKFGIQVTGAGSARTALDLGADYLVCQGMEAGGHVQGIRPLDETLDEVLREVERARRRAPVVACGGIVTGAQIRDVLRRGAAGAALGTRFVATRESRAHAEYKRALVEARDGRDTVCTTCFSKGWSNVPHRILRANPTYQMWEAAGCPPEGGRPGEADVVAHAADGSPIERYRVNPPVDGMTGTVLEMGTFAGGGVGEVRDVPPAGELVARLWREYEEAGA